MSKMTSEGDVLPLIPVETLNEIIDGVAEQSVALAQFARLPNMSSRTTEMPVLDSLVDAQFTSGVVYDDLTYGSDEDGTFTPDTGVPGLKATGDAKWAKKKIVAEPIAIVLPIAEDVLADADYDIWGELRPRIVEAFGKRIDEAIIWGQGRPTSWETGIVPTAIARNNVLVEGTGSDFGIDISNLMGLIEEQGFDPTGFIAEVSTKAKLRNLRSAAGFPLFSGGTMTDPDTLYGHPIHYAKNAAFNKTVARLIVGDMQEAKYSIRQDITFKLFTEGVVTDDYGNIVANLMQNDMVALRVVMRLGWVLPNPIHQLNPNREGYPFAVMTK